MRERGLTSRRADSPLLRLILKQCVIPPAPAYRYRPEIARYCFLPLGLKIKPASRLGRERVRQRRQHPRGFHAADARHIPNVTILSPRARSPHRYTRSLLGCLSFPASSLLQLLCVSLCACLFFFATSFFVIFSRHFCSIPAHSDSVALSIAPRARPRWAGRTNTHELSGPRCRTFRGSRPDVLGQRSRTATTETVLRARRRARQRPPKKKKLQVSMREVSQNPAASRARRIQTANGLPGCSSRVFFSRSLPLSLSLSRRLCANGPTVFSNQATC